MKDSLRIRLLIGIAFGSLILLSLFSVMIYSVTQYTLTRHFDRSLLDTANVLAAVIEEEEIDEHEHEQEDGDEDDEDSFSNGQRKIEFEFDVRMTPEFSTPAGGACYQIWNHDKTIVIKSPSLGDADLYYFKALSKTPQYKKCTLKNGTPARCVGLLFSARGENNKTQTPLSFVLARDAGQLYQHLSFLRWLLVICTITVVLFSIIIARIITKMSLKPIETLADNISQVRMDNLQESHISGRYPIELAPFVDRLNSLYRRLQSSFDQQRRINADIAHELRNPIAGLQSIIEVCLQKTRQSNEYEESMLSCLSIAQSMNRMIESLLSLARLDNHQVTITKEPLSASKLVLDCWNHFAEKANDRNISFSATMSQETTLLSDKDNLCMILCNLFDNAVEYTNDNGRIWVDIAEKPEAITLSIANTGCTIQPEHLEKIYEPFWRNDTSRTQTEKHCGIGLTIAHRIAKALAVDMNVEIKSPDIFEISLVFPK